MDFPFFVMCHGTQQQLSYKTPPQFFQSNHSFLKKNMPQSVKTQINICEVWKYPADNRGLLWKMVHFIR